MIKSTLIVAFSAILCVSSAIAQKITSNDITLMEESNKNLGYQQFSGKINMKVDASDISSFYIDSGAGYKFLTSTDGSDILVKVEIVITTKKSKNAYETLDKYLNLELEKSRDQVKLTSLFDFENNDKNISTGGFFSSPERKINLEIAIPKNLTVKMNDRSGEVEIRNLSSDLKIVDGSGGLVIDGLEGELDLVDHSGNLDIRKVNWESEQLYSVKIKDYSGELRLEKVAGNIVIDDHSGEIIIKGSRGMLSLDDTSGGISVKDHTGDSDIDDSSGEITVSKVDGSVTIRDTSGGISVTDVTQDVHLRSDGSGGFYTSNIQGTVKSNN